MRKKTGCKFTSYNDRRIIIKLESAYQVSKGRRIISLIGNCNSRLLSAATLLLSI